MSMYLIDSFKMHLFISQAQKEKKNETERAI